MGGFLEEVTSRLSVEELVIGRSYDKVKGYCWKCGCIFQEIACVEALNCEQA